MWKRADGASKVSTAWQSLLCFCGGSLPEKHGRSARVRAERTIRVGAARKTGLEAYSIPKARRGIWRQVPDTDIWPHMPLEYHVFVKRKKR